MTNPLALDVIQYLLRQKYLPKIINSPTGSICQLNEQLKGCRLMNDNLGMYNLMIFLKRWILAFKVVLAFVARGIIPNPS